MSPAWILLFVPRSSVLEANCEVFFIHHFDDIHAEISRFLEATSSTTQLKH